MTLHQIFFVVLAILMLVVLPLYGIISTCIWLSTKPSDRPEQRGGGGSVFLPLDRLVQPSVEHRIESEQRVVKEDAELGGE